jgi:tRNA 2-thiouridine synthesizing protein A
MSRPSTDAKEPVSGPSSPAAAAADVQEIDARGISSPLHVLRAHRALRAMRPGQSLRVITSSEQTLAEFQALSKFVVAYELVSQEQFGDEFIHVLRKKR